MGETLPVRVAVHRIELAGGEGSLSEVRSWGSLGYTRAPEPRSRGLPSLGGAERDFRAGSPTLVLCSGSYDPERWKEGCAHNDPLKGSCGHPPRARSAACSLPFFGAPGGHRVSPQAFPGGQGVSMNADG